MLAELTELFGLGRPDSVANLGRRAQFQQANSPTYRRRMNQVEQSLKTEKQV